MCSISVIPSPHVASCSFLGHRGGAAYLSHCYSFCSFLWLLKARGPLGCSISSTPKLDDRLRALWCAGQGWFALVTWSRLPTPVSRPALPTCAIKASYISTPSTSRGMSHPGLPGHRHVHAIPDIITHCRCDVICRSCQREEFADTATADIEIADTEFQIRR